MPRTTLSIRVRDRSVTSGDGFRYALGDRFFFPDRCNLSNIIKVAESHNADDIPNSLATNITNVMKILAA